MDTSVPRSGTLHVTKECSGYTGEAGSFCTIASSELRRDPGRLESRLRQGCNGRRWAGYRHSRQYPKRRHRSRPCGTRWSDTDRQGDAGGWHRGIGETGGGPPGRASCRTQLQLGGAVLVLRAANAEPRPLLRAHRPADSDDRQWFHRPGELPVEFAGDVPLEAAADFSGCSASGLAKRPLGGTDDRRETMEPFSIERDRSRVVR
jgi:hypothetical protein